MYVILMQTIALLHLERATSNSRVDWISTWPDNELMQMHQASFLVANL